jgi:hypothetical protein
VVEAQIGTPSHYCEFCGDVSGTIGFDSGEPARQFPMTFVGITLHKPDLMPPFGYKSRTVSVCSQPCIAKAEKNGEYLNFGKCLRANEVARLKWLEDQAKVCAEVHGDFERPRQARTSSRVAEAVKRNRTAKLANGKRA